MNKPAITGKAEATEQNIERDLLGHYANIQLLGRFVIPLAILINAGAIMVWEPWKNVALWTVFVLGFWALSTFMCHKFHNAPESDTEDLRPWYIYIGAPKFVYNILWGSLVVWAVDPAQPETYFMIIAILVSTIGMNASQSSAVFTYYLLEMFPKLVAILITAFATNEPLHVAIGILSVSACLTFTKIARGIHKSTRLMLTQKYQLIQAKDDIERASRAKSSFLATMSHEVRTPLNGLLGIINLMKYTKLNQQQDEYVETMRYSGETLLTMLNDILDFSKMEAGRLDLEEVPFETSRLVDSVTDLLESRAREKGLAIKAEVFDNVPSFLRADPTRLRQVLLNLTSNAIKFTEKGSITLAVRTIEDPNAKSQNRIMLRFEVADTGIGIPPEAHEHLFEDFTQVDSSTSRKYGGTGLGLSICRRIVEMMRGTIDYDSAVGKGSTFWFAIPVAVATAEEVMSMNEKEQDLPVLRPLNILLAEDNIINQKVAVGLLSQFHHHIDVANNGAEAIEAVQKKKYDLVLMDMQMPVIDGLQATKRIRDMGGDYAKLPVIALSANSLTEEGLDYDSAGVTDHVTKPIRLGHLFETFALHLPAFVLKQGSH
jgi:signal transduction histidine kinase